MESDHHLQTTAGNPSSCHLPTTAAITGDVPLSVRELSSADMTGRSSSDSIFWVEESSSLSNLTRLSLASVRLMLRYIEESSSLARPFWFITPSVLFINCINSFIILVRESGRILKEGGVHSQRGRGVFLKGEERVLKRGRGHKFVNIFHCFHASVKLVVYKN